MRLLGSLISVWCLVTAPLGAEEIETRWRELRQLADDRQLYTLLYALPKGGDLHQHAGGSNRSEWMWDILTDASRNGGDAYYARARFASPPDAIADSVRYHTIRQLTYDRLPEAVRAEYIPLSALTPAERAGWHNAFRLDAAGEGRREFFEAHWPRMGDINRNPAVRFELMLENLKAYAAENVLYLESQFEVDGCVLPDGTALSRDEARARLEVRLAAPEVAALGVTVRFLATILRFSPAAEADLIDTYAWIDANRDRWVGINMAGIEENGFGYPSRFLPTYRQLRARYPALPLAIHAGEMDGPNHHIRDTLLLGATRIGHGLNLIKDPETLLLLQQSRRVLIEINLISNQLLEYTPDLGSHPFPEYLRTGIPVCLNTDDRGMWDSNLTDEYFTAVRAFNLSWAELVALGRNSLHHAFADGATKARLLAAYEERLAAFEARLVGGTPTDVLADLTRTTRPVTYGYALRTWGLAFD